MPGLGTFAEHLRNLARPHYLFQPQQMLMRVASGRRPESTERWVTLVWGDEILCNPAESIGLSLVRRGIFDLVVCEVLLRLADRGETVLDVGANIGQMTSLLGRAVGATGRVVSFEPHPQVHARLAASAARWGQAPGAARFDLLQIALSDEAGTATLATDVFVRNEGSASLEPLTTKRTQENIHTVRVERLDDVLEPETQVGVMKIDVEGHELRALQGAARTLAEGRIRDIVFEERDEPPTPVTRLLQASGYTLLRLGEHVRGPVAGPLGAADVALRDDPSLLATRDPERAVRRLAPRGWAVYGIGPVARRRRAA